MLPKINHFDVLCKENVEFSAQTTKRPKRSSRSSRVTQGQCIFQWTVKYHKPSGMFQCLIQFMPVENVALKVSDLASTKSPFGY